MTDVNNMASLGFNGIIDLPRELGEKKVEHLPPSGPQQVNSQKGFYYRGSLFPSPIEKIGQLTKHIQQLASDTGRKNYVRTKSYEETCHKGSSSERKFKNDTEELQTKAPHSVLRPRRIQSAKAVLERTNKRGNFAVVNMNMNADIPSTAPVVSKLRTRPRSAVILPSQRGNSTSDKSVSRPASARKAFVGVENKCTEIDNLDAELDNTVKPSVYGLKLKRQIYGSDPNIFGGKQKPLADTSPYVLSSDGRVVQSREGDEEHKRSLPVCLEPLRPWLTTSISQDLLCVNPSTCHVFLPSLADDFEDLPIVPSPQDPHEELAQYGPSPSKPIVLKKYSHPFVPKNFEYICNHMKRRNKICAPDGTVLHQRYQGIRTSKIIRKEIIELENLMKGVGSHDSDCSMVQYQADITQLRELADDALARVPYRLKNSPRLDDTFGIHKFCRDHEIIMKQIKEEHDSCLAELALIEEDMDMDEDLRYFYKPELHINVPSCT